MTTNTIDTVAIAASLNAQLTTASVSFEVEVDSMFGGHYAVTLFSAGPEGGMVFLNSNDGLWWNIVFQDSNGNENTLSEDVPFEELAKEIEFADFSDDSAADKW